MSLSSLLTELKVKSGRYDLSDTELTKIINSASQLLDNLNTSANQSVRYYSILEAGEYIVQLPSAIRFCEAISTIVSTEFTQLKKAEYNDIRELLRESIDTGTPEYYTLSNARLATAGEGGELDFPFDLDALTLDPSSIYRYVFVYPKPSVQTAVEVLGVFYSPVLSTEVPDNRWTILRPDLLMQASMYYLTKDLLNIEESSKQLQDLRGEITHIIHDSYSEENIDRMEG